MDVPATVNRILEIKNWTHEDLAREMNVTQPAVSRWASGKVFPRGESYVKLQELAASLIEDPISGARPANPKFVQTPISGTARAGGFQMVDEFENQDPNEVLVERDPEYPNARVLVFDVEGDSMNRAEPPIPHGSRVSGPAFEDLEGREPLSDGMIVVVQRSSADGQMLEWSVKEVEDRDGGWAFLPRSTNARFKPIEVNTDLEADDGTQVEVIALVTNVTMPVRKRR